MEGREKHFRRMLLPSNEASFNSFSTYCIWTRTEDGFPAAIHIRPGQQII